MESIINVILKYDINLLLLLVVTIIILLLLYADIFDDPNLTSNYN